jgi:hypothetical protein
MSPPPAANNGFGSGIHWPPPPATRILSLIDRHHMTKLLLLLPHQLPPPAVILALVTLSTTCRLCKDVATLPSSKQFHPPSAGVHCSVCCCRLTPQLKPRPVTTTTAIEFFTQLLFLSPQSPPHTLPALITLPAASTAAACCHCCCSVDHPHLQPRPNPYCHCCWTAFTTDAGQLPCPPPSSAPA